MARTKQTTRKIKFPLPVQTSRQEFSLPGEYSILQATKTAAIENNRRHFDAKKTKFRLGPEFCVHSMSPLPLEGFSFNFGQMFASVK